MAGPSSRGPNPKMQVRWVRTNSRRSDGSMSRSVGAVKGSGARGRSFIGGRSLSGGSDGEAVAQCLLGDLADGVAGEVVDLVDHARRLERGEHPAAVRQQFLVVDAAPGDGTTHASP